jgi:hypothetical protein
MFDSSGENIPAGARGQCRSLQNPCFAGISGSRDQFAGDCVHSHPVCSTQTGLHALAFSPTFQDASPDLSGVSVSEWRVFGGLSPLLALFSPAADFELTLAILFDERTAATLALAVS